MSRDLSDIVIAPYAEGDEHEILRVFTKVFGVERSLETWRWQYLQNPAGTHIYLAKFPDGQVVSQFCGVPRRVRVRDTDYCFSEIVDSYTDPDFRQGLKKPGLFASTCYAFVEHFGHLNEEVIMYGLPNPPAYRVGSRLLGYSPFYKVHLLTKDLSEAVTLESSDRHTLADGTTVATIDRFSDDATNYFNAFSQHHEVLTVRDSKYLNWRYVDRPDATYDLCAFTAADGAPLGFAALRHRWLDQPETVPAELLVDPGHPSTPLIVQHLEGRSKALGSERMRVMLRPDSVESQGLCGLGYTPERSQFRLVARTYSEEVVPLDWLQASWYVTMGDFDIV